jgi:carboxynorspermidine decarboxylase
LHFRIIMTDPRIPRFDPEQIPSPCYVLDEIYLENNLELIARIKSQAGIRILVALKGFAMWSTFPLLKKYLDGATASSLHEAMLCHEEFHQKAHLCAPIYLESEIEKITDIASHITFNSIQQFYRFRDQAIRKGLKMAIRINPEYSEVGTELYNPCVPGSRLGVTRAVMGKSLPEGITGLHFHSLCEQNADALENTLLAIEEDYDIRRFIGIITHFRKKYNLDIIAEPGEAVGWQTGFLVATVQDIIQANGYQTAMLDVSFSAHMPDCLEMPYKPKIWGALEPTSGLPTYRMGGNTCLAGDFMGDYSFPETLKPGDKLVLEDMIHYTMVKTTTFNGVNHPSIGIWQKDNSFRQVRSFGYEDYKSNLS